MDRTQYEALLQSLQNLRNEIHELGGTTVQRDDGTWGVENFDAPAATEPSIEGGLTRAQVEEMVASFRVDYSKLQAANAELAKVAADAREQLAAVTAERNDLKAMVESLTAPPANTPANPTP